MMNDERPLALWLVLGLLGAGALAGVAVNLAWMPQLMAFLRSTDAMNEPGVSEDLVHAGFLGGAVTAYGSLIVVLIFVGLRMGWARYAWLGALLFVGLTEGPFMFMHWMLADMMSSLDGLRSSSNLPPRSEARVMMYTPQLFMAKAAVLAFLCAATPALFLPVIGRWMKRKTG